MEYQKFSTLAESFGVSLDPVVFSKLEVYLNTLLEWNEKINLTAVTARDEVFIKHFLDSMAAAPYLPEGAALCDIGTGAGFPGVVLKLVRPDVTLTLIDSLAKRVRFLEDLTEKLGVDATCVHARAEEAARGPYRDAFTVVVSRAVAQLNTLYEYALPLVRPGGTFIAYKAHCEEELTASKRVPALLGARQKQVVRLSLPPDGETRTLVIAEKLAPTPAKYPRGKNKERTAPLQ